MCVGIYLYTWRKKFTKWVFVTNKMCLIQMMVIYFIKSTLKDICLLGAAGNSCLSGLGWSYPACPSLEVSAWTQSEVGEAHPL